MNTVKKEIDALYRISSNIAIRNYNKRPKLIMLKREPRDSILILPENN